jgi:hypothetical protein
VAQRPTFDPEVLHVSNSEKPLPLTVPPVIVHIVYEPSAMSDQIVKSLFRDLTGDPTLPLQRGPGIPMRFLQREPVLRLADASVNVVAALVDTNFLAEGRIDEIPRLEEETHKAGGRFIPIALDKKALRTEAMTKGSSWIRAFESPHEAEQQIVTEVAHAAAKGLEPSGLVRVFLSHAKHDSAEIMTKIRQAIDKTQLGEFFDARSIEFGDDFADVITREVRRSAVLAVLTDTYSAREWCRIESLEAKLASVPVVVVDAIQAGSHRAMPYLGNVTVVRWDKSAAEASAKEAVRSMAIEVLRVRAFRSRVTEGQLVKRLAASATLPYAPEALTAVPLALEGKRHLVYPDPPLSNHETKVLASVTGGLLTHTPTQLAATSGATPDLLPGRLVGIAISDPGHDELRDRGLLAGQLTRAYVELSRHLLAAGASLIYGGAIQIDQSTNFLALLLDLVAAYDLPGRPTRNRIRNYQSIAATRKLAADDKARINAVGTLIAVPTRSADTAAALTGTREKMASDSDALVALGGRLTGFQGDFPGVVEECYCAIKASKPLYLIGSFGGAATAVVDLISGINRNEIQLAYQTTHTSGIRRSAGTVTGRRRLERRYRDLSRTMLGRSWDALNNGLDEGDNRRLWASDDPETCAALILLGLGRIYSR